jgi:hypothetical protein
MPQDFSRPSPRPGKSIPEKCSKNDQLHLFSKRHQIGYINWHWLKHCIHISNALVFLSYITEYSSLNLPERRKKEQFRVQMRSHSGVSSFCGLELGDKEHARQPAKRCGAGLRAKARSGKAGAVLKLGQSLPKVSGLRSFQSLLLRRPR